MSRGRVRAFVRAPVWWSAKILPVVAAGELAAWTARTPHRNGIRLIVAMVVSAIGVAALAHVVNDLSDLASDRLAGKPNGLSAAPRSVVAMVLAVCTGIGAGPWFVVHLPWTAATILTGIVVVSFVYSARPLRLKERGFAGVVADAAVAHVLPTTFAFVLLGSAGRATPNWWVAWAASVVWSAGFGVRAILAHQILDEAGDRRGGVSTYAVRYRLPVAVQAGHRAFAVELAGLAVLAGIAGATMWPVSAFFAAHFVLWVHHRRFDHRALEPVPTRPGEWLPLGEFYQVWPALVFGIALWRRDAAWAVVPVGVVVLFWPWVLKQAVDQVSLLVEFLREVGLATGHASVALARAVRDVSVTEGWRIRVWAGRALSRIGVGARRFFWEVIEPSERFVREHTWSVARLFVMRQWRRIRRRLPTWVPGSRRGRPDLLP